MLLILFFKHRPAVAAPCAPITKSAICFDQKKAPLERLGITDAGFTFQAKEKPVYSHKNVRVEMLNPVFRTDSPIVLASGSPRRREFLAGLGLDFTVARPKRAEPMPTPGEAPDAFALRTARAKAEEVAPLYSTAAVIAADTVVALEQEILGKPADEREALSMLQKLCGQEHVVYSACCIRLPNGQEECFCPASAVLMRDWPLPVLRAYVASGESADKAGAYAMQGLGAFLIECINGSWTNIVGLPLPEVVEVLLRHKIISPIS